MTLIENTTTAAGSEPTVSIRQYRVEDRAVVLELFAAGMLYYADFYPHYREFWADYVAESSEDDLANIHGVYMVPGGNFWVATINDEVVGMVGLELKPEGAGELRRMSVKAGARRYGVGRLLVTHLESWAKNHGLKSVWLGTGAVMTQARKFYASMGYDQTKIEVVSEDPYFEAVLFTKTL